VCLEPSGSCTHVCSSLQIRQLDAMLEDPAVAADVLPTLGGINCLYVLQDMLDAGIRWD
jgi:hypothetical protein